MSDAREHVLAAVRAALGDRAGMTPPRSAPAVQSPTPREQLVALFIERLSDYGASVTRSDPATVGDALRDACERHAARRLAIPPGLPDSWRPDGIELIADDQLTPQQLDALDGVITGAALGIAESGTIALDGAPDQGRRALTLIPDLHLCVIEADRVVASLPDALPALAAAIDPGGRPITLISGPSATSDIELRRVQGVHGPRRLEAIIVGG